ncbi:putative pre-rRNA processing protein [Thermoascus aurantiacus ATCC 26904]
MTMTEQTTTTAITLTPEQQSKLDLGITLALHNWPALTLAVQSSWGGPTSADKRDWLCGAISDLLQDRPDTDAEDLEDVLVQVMNDEFDVVVDDGSAEEVAKQIMELRAQVARNEFEQVQAMWEAWKEKEERRKKGGAGRDDDAARMFKRVEDQEDSDEDDDDDDEEDGEEMDVDMDEAPPLARAPREKVQPEVDEEGFTKVVGRRRR